MKHIYLINPAAGRSDSTDMLSEQIRAAYEDGQNEAVLYRTAGVGDATRYVREYCIEHPDEEVRFFACGGDGTFNEVAAGAQGFAYAAVGLIPVGTGNDFMRNFVGTDRFMDVSAQKEGEVMELDLIRCNDYYGVNLLNTGFANDICKRILLLLFF